VRGRSVDISALIASRSSAPNLGYCPPSPKIAS
jgi:hypothetical protein